MNQLVFFVYATRKIDSVCRNLFDDRIQSRKKRSVFGDYAAACENRLLFPFKEKSSKKGAVKIEENQKLYKHMERGESYLCNQRLSAPVPCHVQPDGLVCPVTAYRDSLWGAAALFHD